MLIKVRNFNLLCFAVDKLSSTKNGREIFLYNIFMVIFYKDNIFWTAILSDPLWTCQFPNNVSINLFNFSNEFLHICSPISVSWYNKVININRSLLVQNRYMFLYVIIVNSRFKYRWKYTMIYECTYLVSIHNLSQKLHTDDMRSFLPLNWRSRIIDELSILWFYIKKVSSFLFGNPFLEIQ